MNKKDLKPMRKNFVLARKNIFHFAELKELLKGMKRNFAEKKHLLQNKKLFSIQ